MYRNNYSWQPYNDKVQAEIEAREKALLDRANSMNISNDFLRYLDDIKDQLDRIEHTLARIERQQN